MAFFRRKISKQETWWRGVAFRCIFTISNWFQGQSCTVINLSVLFSLNLSLLTWVLPRVNTVLSESRLRLNYQRKKMILFFYLTIPESVLLLSCVCFFPFYSHFCDISAKYNKCKYLWSAFIFVFHENVSVWGSASGIMQITLRRLCLLYTSPSPRD